MTRRTRSLLRRIARREEGNTIIEFALVSPVFLLLLLGIGDLGFRQYIGSMLQGTLDQAARQVTIGGVTTASVKAFVQANIQTVLPSASVNVTPQSYQNFTNVKQAEPITTDYPPIGTLNSGDCFLDLNSNGVRDLDSGASGTGSGDDIVYYTATVSYAPLFPMNKWLGFPSPEIVSATTMMRNQPYAAQTPPPTVCVP